MLHRNLAAQKLLAARDGSIIALLFVLLGRQEFKNF
jgi:hypothetical protein